MTHSRKKIDKALDGYASRAIADGKPYSWWWNGNDVLAVAIASICRHLRRDGTTEYTAHEIAELEKLERYMSEFGGSWGTVRMSHKAWNWLHAEAMWLLSKWFFRMWD